MLRFWLPTLLLVYIRVGAAQAISFLPPVNAYVSGYSRATSMCQSCLATADFNSDGKPDIVYSVAELTPFTGMVLGNGDGTFRPGATFLASSPSGRPFTGDFNGDGKPDIAFSGATVSVFIGDGTGNFSASITVAGCASISLVTDLNGDRKADLVCGASVLLSNGDGTFHAAPALSGAAVLAADFDHDGKADLLVTNGAAQLSVALGRGDGSFGSVTPITGAFGLQMILAGDFNSDGEVDLAGALVDQAEVVVLPGRGDGSFGPSIATQGLVGPLTAVADFNHDGKADLVAGDAILAGNGNGTFRYPVYVGVVTQPCGGAAPASLLTLAPCDFTRSGVAIADFNGDGLPDIAAGYVSQGIQNTGVAAVSVLLNDSPGDGFNTAGVSSLNAGSPILPNSYATAYGTNLAPSTATAAANPRPDTLGGIRVHVRDRSHTNEILAPLLYVSPSQVNYILPSDDPYAWITIERVGAPYVAKGMAVPVGPAGPLLAPVLFSVGGGLGAASAVRVAPNGIQTPVDASAPIDLSGDPVYLTLYGTGFARAATANCFSGSQVIAATYVGAPNLSGLDQINLPLPKSLAGVGAIPVSCAIDDVTTNSVKITIR